MRCWRFSAPTVILIQTAFCLARWNPTRHFARVIEKVVFNCTPHRLSTSRPEHIMPAIRTFSFPVSTLFRDSNRLHGTLTATTTGLPVARRPANLRRSAGQSVVVRKTFSALRIFTAALPASLSGIRKTSSAVPVFSSVARKTHAALPNSPALGTIWLTALWIFPSGHPNSPSAVPIFPSAASILSAINCIPVIYKFSA